MSLVPNQIKRYFRILINISSYQWDEAPFHMFIWHSGFLFYRLPVFNLCTLWAVFFSYWLHMTWILPEILCLFKHCRYISQRASVQTGRHFVDYSFRWVQGDLIKSESAGVTSMPGSSLTCRTEPAYWAWTTGAQERKGEETIHLTKHCIFFNNSNKWQKRELQNPEARKPTLNVLASSIGKLNSLKYKQ